MAGVTEARLAEIEEYAGSRLKKASYLHRVVEDLVAAVKARDGILHDMQQDSASYRQGYADGLRAARGAVRSRLEGHRNRQSYYDANGERNWAAMNDVQADTLEGLLTDLEGGYDLPSGPLPPDVVRRENAALRRRVAELEAAAGGRRRGRGGSAEAKAEG